MGQPPGDFGVNGNYDKATAGEYEKALHDHLADPDTQYIDGTYRKQPVDIYYNSRTGNAMFADKSGNYISGWRLSPDQTTNLLTNGNVQ